MDVPVEKIPDETTSNLRTPKKFSDIYGQQEYDFPGEQVEEKDIRDKEMTIYDFVLLNGQFGEFAVVDAELSEGIEVIDQAQDPPANKTVKRIQFCEGSDVIRHQLKKAKEDRNLPLIAKIVEKTSDKSKMTYRTLQ